MADPLAVQLANEFRQQLIERDGAAMAEMTRRWLAVELALEDEALKLAEELTAKQAAGQEISRSKLLKLERYQRLLAQVQEQLTRFNGTAQSRIEAAALQNALQGIQDATALINAVANPDRTVQQVEIVFDRLGVDAAERIMALARAGQPLGQILQRSYPLAVEGITNKLVTGIASGVNPREIARQIVQEGMAEGLNHILLVARDQGNRSYREGSRQQYLRSGVVDGYHRLAAKQPGRTCLACIALDGTVYATDELMALHPQDRCTMVPNVKGFKPPTWTAGEAYFRSLPREVQAEWLGPARWELWQEGRFEFSRLVKVVKNETWGPSAQVRPVGELMK